MHSYKIIINFTPLLLTQFIIMYLERDELLSKEQEQDVLDIWRKSINEFPYVRIKKLEQYCEQNNCNISVAIDLLYCYLQSEYTCVIDDLYYFFCGDVIMEEYFFTKDKECFNKVNYEYILENDPTRYGSLFDYEYIDKVVPDFIDFLSDCFTDLLELNFKNNFTSFKDIDEMYEYYYKYFEKVDELFYYDQYYDIEEGKIDLNEIKMKMKHPVFVKKISRKKIEEDLKILDDEVEKENYRLTNEEYEIKDNKFISNCYRDFLRIFGQGERLSKAFLIVFLKYIKEDSDLFKIYLPNLLKTKDKDEYIKTLIAENVTGFLSDMDYMDNKIIMCVIDEIDNNLTNCQDTQMKSKKADKIINDLGSTSSIIKIIKNRSTTEAEALYKICFDENYMKSTEDFIEKFIYQIVNYVYFPFLRELFSLFKCHEINIADILKKCNNSKFYEEYYDIGESETLNENSKVREPVKTSFDEKLIVEIFNSLVPKYAQCEIDTLLALFGKVPDNGDIIIWKGSKVELEVFLQLTIIEEQSSRNRMGLPRKKIEKWFSDKNGTIIKAQKKMSCNVESYDIYKDVFKKLSTL